MGMDRRRFIKICSAATTLAGIETSRIASLHAEEPLSFGKSQLVDNLGHPVKVKLLSAREAYIFHYPFQGTPCFLINLERPPEGGITLATEQKTPYTWEGGTGPNGTLVAFSAICAHQLSYPSKEVSAITYTTAKSPVAERSDVIVCCAHNSVYDPAQGARVLSGPATQPLAAIRLAYDAQEDELYATGVYGGTLFDTFFRAYRQELIEQYGRGVAKELVTEKTALTPLSEFTRQQLRC
jgi:arsenite oxidase small subunit